ncbi:MAG: ABC transporter ATP-binding protein [Chloroflexota bacterium]
MNKPLAIETTDLTKAYDGNMVVEKLNLHIEEGEIFGFLGPNGAGKTTTILMLLGLTEPTAGTAKVYGFNSTREPLKVKHIAGYIPEKVGFYEDLSARYNLLYTARLNGLLDNAAKERIDASLKRVGLAEVAKNRVGTFSRGMKQRLAIADILIKLPKIAFLDEPTASIDPEGVVQILDLIKGIAKETGMTVIISSHQLTQVQRICHRVGIMMKGKMVLEGFLDELEKGAPEGGRYKVQVKMAEITSVIIDSLKRIKGVSSVENVGDSLVVSCATDLRPQIAKAVVDNNGSLVQMTIQSYSLEDIYLKYSSEA